MKARRSRINRNCKWRLSTNLQSVWHRFNLKWLCADFFLSTITWDLMFSTDFLFAIKRDTSIFKETRWFCRFPKHQNCQLEMAMWAMHGECMANMLAQTSHCRKLSTKPSLLQFCKIKIKTNVVAKKKRDKRRIYGLLVDERDLRGYTKQVKTSGKKKAAEGFIHEWRGRRIVINY